MSIGSVTAAHAQQGQNGTNQNGTNQNGNPQNVLAATPELDSVFLFGSGLIGVVGYAALRRRARR